MEKEQAYQDAAKNYENAWKFGNQNNPGIGEIRGHVYIESTFFHFQHNFVYLAWGHVVVCVIILWFYIWHCRLQVGV